MNLGTECMQYLYSSLPGCCVSVFESKNIMINHDSTICFTNLKCITKFTMFFKFHLTVCVSGLFADDHLDFNFLCHVTTVVSFAWKMQRGRQLFLIPKKFKIC